MSPWLDDLFTRQAKSDKLREQVALMLNVFFFKCLLECEHSALPCPYIIPGCPTTTNWPTIDESSVMVAQTKPPLKVPSLVLCHSDEKLTVFYPKAFLWSKAESNCSHCFHLCIVWFSFTHFNSTKPTVSIYIIFLPPIYLQFVPL